MASRLQLALAITLTLTACIPAPKVASGAAPSRPQLCTCAASPGPATFLVDFGPSQYDLRPKALSILATVVVDDQRLSFGHIYISAFTDSSDAPSDDEKLAWKRAHAVEKRLVADGISPSKLEIVSHSVVNRYVDSSSWTNPHIVPAKYRRFVEIQGDKSLLGTTNFLIMSN